MTILKLFSILLILVSVSLQSCGGKTDQGLGSEKNGPSVQTPNIETELKRAKERLSSVESENHDLQASKKILSEKLKELQEAAEAEANGPTLGKSSEGPSRGISEQTRIALMGAKAIAEFRAQQTEKRLESVTAELTKKDDDLKSALEQLEAASHENGQLKNQLETATAEADQEKSELEQTVKKLESTIAERTSAIGKLEASSKEKEDLLNTLKKAWSDATQLKGSAEADLNQFKTSFAEYQNQTNQLKTSLEEEKKATGRLSGELESLKKDYSSCMAQAQQLKAQADAYLKQIQDFKSTNVDQAPKQQVTVPVPKANEKPSSIIEKLLDGVVTDNSSKEK